jgi:diguanylate cyclase (GGDEF)-like protein
MSEFDYNQYAHNATPEQFHPLLDKFVDPENKLLVLSWILRSIEEELRAQLRHDALTGVDTAGTWYDKVDRQLDLNPNNTAIVVIDITNFKKINTELGQAWGDVVLRQIAEMMGEHFRPSPIGRLGGDEFGILLDTTPRDIGTRPTKQGRLNIIADRFAEQIAIMHDDNPHLRKDHSIDIAFGLAHYVQNDTPETLFRRAELAMQKMKNKQHEELGSYRTPDFG